MESIHFQLYLLAFNMGIHKYTKIFKYSFVYMKDSSYLCGTIKYEIIINDVPGYFSFT